MKTLTNLVTGGTVSAASGAYLLATVDLNALSVNDILLSVRQINGSTSPGVGKVLKVKYAFTVADVTAIGDSRPAVVRPSAETFTVNLASTASLTSYFISDKLLLKGRYITFWVEHDGLKADLTVTIDVVS